MVWRAVRRRRALALDGCRLALRDDGDEPIARDNAVDDPIGERVHGSQGIVLQLCIIAHCLHGLR